MKRLLLKGSFIAYLLIGLEIFIMISPFAAYFYTLYSPIINFLYASKYTSWLTEFFLPHFVFIDNPVIKFIGMLQFLTFFSGIALFFYAAIPLYYSKFMKKGIVTKGIYCRIRHPQYLGLGIAGFGLLLYWPRFLILLTYVTMLFVYYLLARNEEQRMISKYGKGYKDYMDSVPMFLPKNIGEKIFNLVFGNLKSKTIAIVVLYLFIVLTSTGVALLLRNYSISILNMKKIDGLSVITVLPMDINKLENIIKPILERDETRKIMEDKKASLAYVMPSDFFLMAILTDLERLYPIEFEKPSGGNTVTRFFRIFISYTKFQMGMYPEEHGLKRIIFVSVRDRDNKYSGSKSIFSLGAKRYPVFHMDIDENGKIIFVKALKPGHKWGDIPMPVF
ncbi:MAG: methyltransferase family protein [Thermodesulfovibrionales bacterium]